MAHDVLFDDDDEPLTLSDTVHILAFFVVGLLAWCVWTDDPRDDQALLVR